MKPEINNPVGVSGLVLAFLVSLTGLAAILWEIDPAVIGAINVVLGAGVALVAEVTRRRPKAE